MVRPLALASALALLAGCATKSDVDQLAQKVDALQQQVDGIKSQPAGAAAKPTAEDEQKAMEVYQAIQEAMNAGKVGEAKAKLAELEGKYGSTRAASRAGRMANELGVVGKEVHNSDITTTNWYQGTTSDLDIEHGTTLLVFFEQWCPHCQREVPKLEVTYEKYKGRMNLVCLTKVTRSSSDEKVAEFVKEHGLTYPVAKEDGSASRTFAVSGIPAAAVVKDGKVLWRGHPAQLNDQMLERFING